jgi:hypothetical protein
LPVPVSLITLFRQEMNRQQLSHIIPIPLLAWAFAPTNSYAYYTFLRIVCCGCFFFSANHYKRSERENWFFAMVGLGIVYNPVFPIHLDRTFWSIVNIATIAVLIAALTKQRKAHE